MSINKKLKTLALMFSAFAFLGSLSLACLSLKSIPSTKAADYQADLSYDEGEGKFVYYYNGSPLDVELDYIDYYQSDSIAILYCHDVEEVGYHLAEISEVTFSPIPVENEEYVGSVDGYFNEGNIIHIQNFGLDAVPIRFQSGSQTGELDGTWSLNNGVITFTPNNDWAITSYQYEELKFEGNNCYLTINLGGYENPTGGEYVTLATKTFTITDASWVNEAYTLEGIEYVGYVYGVCEELIDEGQTVTATQIRSVISPTSEYSYTISFDGNGATDGSMASETVTTSDEQTTYSLPQCGYVRDSYDFLGWSDNPDDSDGLSVGTTVQISSDTTYYAIWSENEQQTTYRYVVEFDGNGATGGSTASETITSPDEIQNYTLPGCGFDKDGYEFVGWSESANADEGYSAGTLVEISGNTLYYAIWREVEPQTQEYTYEITFNGNGATSGSTPSETITGENEVFIYNLPSCGFEKDGYNFIGWARYPDDDETIQPEDSYELTESVTFYAIWEEIPVTERNFEVIFYANGGTGEMESETFKSDTETYQYSLPVCSFVNDGYDFVGWGLIPDTADVIKPEQTYYLTEGMNYFYAIWEKSAQIYTYTVTFDGNGGNGVMSSRVYEEGNQEVPSCEFEREGYSFVGWAVDAPDSDTIIYAGDNVYVSKDYTLYALWEEETPVTEEYSFEIIFDSNNGTGETYTDSFTQSEKPAEYNLPSQAEVPFSYEGYTFVGWSLFSDGEVVSDLCLVEDGTTRFYAIWEENTPEPDPEYRQYWTYTDQELRWVDEAHPDYLTRVDKAVYSERNSTASVTVSILDETESVVEFKYISLTSVSYTADSVTGYFNLLIEGDNVITLYGLEVVIEKIPETEEEKVAEISEEQIAQINSLLPEEQDSRVEEVINDLNQGTAYQIVEVATDAKAFIDELRQEGGEGYTEEDYQRDLVTVQSATEAAVVVGAASKESNISAQVEEMTKSAPEDHGVDLGGVLKEFYDQQMSYLLGEEVAKKEGEQPTRRITRAEAPKVNKVDVNDFLKQEFDQMLDFVDRSVDNIQDTLLQTRKCSHETVKMAVNRSITTITSKSFRDFDKEKADREFVETLEPVMMATMQSQVLSILEEQYKNSDHRNQEKDKVMLDEIEAIKDIETFRIIVMEVLKQKYESLPGAVIYDDLQEFTDKVYWPAFEAWALNKESPVGFTFEDLTKATIETSTKRANRYEIATSADKTEYIFISVFAGITVLAIGGAIAIPTILNKKRRGLSK